jgi:hypothetical protein
MALGERLPSAKVLKTIYCRTNVTGMTLSSVIPAKLSAGVNAPANVVSDPVGVSTRRVKVMSG